MVEPAVWVDDTTVTECSKCYTTFGSGYSSLSKHHCRKCGNVFCDDITTDCTRLRMLIPEDKRVRRPKSWFNKNIPGVDNEDSFRAPQRVCNACALELEDRQPELRLLLSRANQELDEPPPSYFTLPQINYLLQNEILNATATLGRFSQQNFSSSKDPALELKETLDGVKGIVFLSTVKAGFIFTGCYGTGLVIAKLSDGSWSAPSAITMSSVGCGWQIGAEKTDTMFFLPNESSVKAFSSRGQLSLGATVAGTVGPLGLGMAADVTAGNKGVGAAESHILPQGLFFGAALEASVIAARKDVNHTFYGEEVSTTALLTGNYPRPKGAEPLYRALDRIMGTSFADELQDSVTSTSPSSSSSRLSAANGEEVGTPMYQTLDECRRQQLKKSLGASNGSSPGSETI